MSSSSASSTTINTHRLEAAMLDGLRRRRVTLALSLEMFERDTQGGLDTYLSAASPRREFLQVITTLAPLCDRLPDAGRDGESQRMADDRG